MSSTQREFFVSNGYLQLRGFHPKARLAALKQEIVDEIKRSSSHAGASRSLRRLPVFQQITKLSTLVKVRDVHEVLVTPELIDLIAEVGGRSPSIVQETQLLLSPTHQGTWTLKSLNWHVDIKADHRDLVPGVQAFFLIDDVGPHGGATLALAGSQLSVNRSHSLPRLKQVLRSHTDLELELQELGIHILEMSGQAGDVFLMDMRVLHTPSINSSAKVRMMATCRCFLDGQS